MEHTFVTIRKDEINVDKLNEQLLKVIPTRHDPDFTLDYFSNYGCYGGFFSIGNNENSKYHYYFGFFGYPNWAKDLVDEFNSAFSNIKIKLVSQVDATIRDLSGSSKKFPCTFSLFEMFLNPEYTSSAVVCLRYVVHHFFRMLSYDEYRIKSNELIEKPDGSLLKYIIELNNSTNEKSGYRALSEKDITLEDF